VTTRIKKVSAAVAVAAAMAAVPAAASAVTSDGHRTPAAGRSVVLDASQAGFAAKAGAAAKSAADTAKRPVTAVVGEGRVDGQAWKVALTYYPTFPKGFTPPPQTPPPGWPKNQPWPTHKGHSLLCLNVTLGAKSLSGGPLDSCDIVNGPNDTTAVSSGGLWGTKDKGTTGTHLLIVRFDASSPTIAHAVATYRNGHHLTVPAIPLPTTGYRAYAIPVAAGNPLTTVDDYDTHNHLVSHNTQWR